MKFLKIKIFGLCSVMFFAVISCNSSKTKESNAKEKNTVESTQAVKHVSVIKVNSPKAGELFTVGDEINIDAELKDVEIRIDSLVFESNGTKINVNPKEISFKWETNDFKVGQNKLRISAYSDGQKVDSYSLRLRFKSDIVPELYECKIINTYNHDKGAYTQGLVYEDGIIYEGTGQKGKSILKKMNFETGKLIAELSLPQEYFGEGITIFKDKIVQLTWRSHTGFVYYKNSFKLLSRFEYPTEGWGITTDGEKLLMSDGTNKIHFLDPEYFNEMGSIEIFDNCGSVDSLNELEYINGLLFANVYQQSYIIAIDPKTGKVLQKIGCKNLVPKEYVGDSDNVLNGIAYDKDNNRIFITGKRWPNLFEVKFVK
jgi:glutamine cyclotransferase